MGRQSITWVTIRTRAAIVMYMESIGDARSFLSAAREMALTKPIIVIKAGRTDAGRACSSFSHRRAYGKR